MLDFDPHQQEENLAHHHVLEVIFGLLVLELDVQAVLDAHLQTQSRVALRAVGSKREGGFEQLSNRVGDDRAAVELGKMVSEVEGSLSEPPQQREEERVTNRQTLPT